MPGMHIALGYLNKIYGDPVLLVEHKEVLLTAHAPAPSNEEVASQLRDTAQHLLAGETVPGAPVSGVNTEAVLDILEALPPAILEAGRAIIYSNLRRDEPLGMTFAWTPGYETELTVCESPATSISKGWITVLIKGRYPGDAHPVTG